MPIERERRHSFACVGTAAAHLAAGNKALVTPDDARLADDSLQLTAVFGGSLRSHFFDPPAARLKR